MAIKIVSFQASTCAQKAQLTCVGSCLDRYAVKVIGAIVVGLAVLAGPVGPAFAQPAKPVVPAPQQKSAERSAESPKQDVTQTIPGLTAFADGFVRMGALACASRVNQVSEFLAGDPHSKSAGFIFPVPQPADRRMLSMSLGIDVPGVPTTYIDASFAPNQASGCEAAYEAVTYWPQSCAAVVTKQFPASQPAPDMGGLKMLVIGLRARVFLLPAGAGCVSIKKELVVQ